MLFPKQIRLLYILKIVDKTHDFVIATATLCKFSQVPCLEQISWDHLVLSIPTTRVCAFYRAPFGCYENLIRSDLFIYSSCRSVSWCYNQTNTKLAFHSNETTKDKLSIT